MLKGTLLPAVHFDQKFLSLLVAVIGTTLSAYLYTWQSNQEVEEEITMGRRRLVDRKGATKQELRETKNDVVAGMFFSNDEMYSSFFPRRRRSSSLVSTRSTRRRKQRRRFVLWRVRRRRCCLRWA